jgi:hypothetical protein
MMKNGWQRDSLDARSERHLGRCRQEKEET